MARRGACRRSRVRHRHWALRYAPRQAVLPATERAAPWIALSVGPLLAGLAAWLVTASARTERRAVALASRMTADLARSNAELERFASVASHDLRERSRRSAPPSRPDPTYPPAG